MEEQPLSLREARRIRLREARDLILATPCKQPGFEKHVRVLGDRLVIKLVRTKQDQP